MADVVAFQARNWTAEEALARMGLVDWKRPAHSVLPQAEIDRCKVLVGGDQFAAQSIEATIRDQARPWTAAMRAEWKEGLSKLALHPCLWLRWAVTRMGVKHSSEALRAFGLWHTSLLLEGQLAVVKSKFPGTSKSKDASLSMYGDMKGHGTPAHLFVLEPYTPEVEKLSWRVKMYDLPRKEQSSPKSAGSKSAAGTLGSGAAQSRGRGVTQAVDSAVNTLCQNGDAVTRLAQARRNGARFQTNMNRDDLVKLIGKDKLVKQYAQTTIRAVLSGIVVTQRGRPTRT